MGKKNRPRKLSVYGRLEGDREKAFIRALIEIYKTTSSGINPFFDGNGGDPNKIVRSEERRVGKECA